jgi:hypothetical protein
MKPAYQDLRLDPGAMRAEGERIAAEQRQQNIEEYADTVWAYFNTEPVAHLSLAEHIEIVIFARDCTFPEAAAACLKVRRDNPLSPRQVAVSGGERAYDVAPSDDVVDRAKQAASVGAGNDTGAALTHQGEKP